MTTLLLAVLLVYILGRDAVVWYRSRVTVSPTREPEPVEIIPAAPVIVLDAADTTAVETAVYDAFAYVGLPVDRFSREFNLVRTGKTHDILQRAAKTLDADLVTVGDVIDHLVKVTRS